MLRRPSEFSFTYWAFLVLALIVTAVLALGAHDLAIAHLAVPYPDSGRVPGWALYVGMVVQIAALVFVCRLAALALKGHNAIVAATLVGATIVLLNETIRVMVINTVLVNGALDAKGAFELIDALPKALILFSWGCAALLLARLPGRGVYLVMMAFGVLAIAAFAGFVFPPLLHSAAAAAEHALGLADPDQVYEMPFNLHVYAFIYGMFVEPVFATFALAWLLWPALKGSNSRKITSFIVLVLLVRGRIISTGLFSFWVPQPLGLAFAAEGQFLVETLIMAALVGLAWAFVTKPQHDIQRREA